MRSRRSMSAADSSRLGALVLSPRVRSAVRDLAIVLAASWLARGAFVAAIGDAHSLDVSFWQAALQAQDEGENPYETGVINWPPFWLQVIVAVDFVANLVGIAFWSALRLYLVLVESALVVTLYLTLVSVGAPRAAVRRALLVGIALNPVTIILVCQHGNSDVQVGLLVALAAAALIAHRRTRDVVFWLAGCLLLGLGVLAKTAPLVLAPILAPGASLATRPGRVLGAALLLGPAALGLSVILALVPRAALDHVIGYRSTPGFWGLSGIVFDLVPRSDRTMALTVAVLLAAVLAAWSWRRASSRRPSVFRTTLLALLLVILVVVLVVEALERLTPVDTSSEYSLAFTLCMLVGVPWVGYRLWGEEPLDPARLFLLIALTFLVVVAFGPGYGAQYAYWFVPALVATYVLLDDSWRRLLRIAWVVAGLTYAVEYAVVDFLGAWAVAMVGSREALIDFGEYLSTPHHWVVFRIPLFAVYLMLIAAGVARLADPHAPEGRRQPRTRSSGDSGERTSPPAASPGATAPGRP
jgi:hypothetical protein